MKYCSRFSPISLSVIPVVSAVPCRRGQDNSVSQISKPDSRFSVEKPVSALQAAGGGDPRGFVRERSPSISVEEGGVEGERREKGMPLNAYFLPSEPERCRMKKNLFLSKFNAAPFLFPPASRGHPFSSGEGTECPGQVEKFP